MKILIVGNMGYVGPGVVSQLRTKYPTSELIGYDMGYFGNCLSNPPYMPEMKLNRQITGDVRYFDNNLLEGIDAVIYLAAISNDPMGKKYEDITMDVNYKSAVRMAEAAKNKGVKSFVFASSCSMYGKADNKAKSEGDDLNPLTAYARSKVAAEKDLRPLASDKFTVTCLRFATACGYSHRLRLDLVLNDFVASAVASKQITILSDGTPWRPLINVLDMARAIEWAITRKAENGGNFLAVNTGSNVWNYTVKELAEAVAEIIPGIKISVNPDAPPDNRSYKVNFSLYEKLAPAHQPAYDLKTTIRTLKDNLEAMNFCDTNFRETSFMIRLKALDKLQSANLLNNNLEWNWK
ncbi:MAG: SDR family oxidoreductase [Bacteroidales bacterium]|nr:SDR family oxidoreductase [Bacteroidales bacterium]